MLLFVVVIVGGFGSITGSLVGSFLVGLVDTIGKALFPDISRFYRDAKIVEIYERARDIEKLVIARQLLKGRALYI